MTSSSNKIFAWGVLTSGVAVGIMGLVNYFARRSLALGLHADAFAFFYGCFALVTLFGTCIDFGSGSALNILMPKFQVSRKQKAMRAYFSVALGIRLAAACVVTGFLMILTPWLSCHVFHFPGGTHVLLWTLGALPFFAVFYFIIDISSALQEFAFRSWLMVGQALMVFIGILVFLPLLGAIAPAAAFIASYVISIPVSMIILLRKYPFLWPLPALSFHLLRRLWHLSRWFFIVSAGMALLTNLDSIILAAFSSLHNLALYNVAIPVTHIFQGLLVVPAVFMPVAAALWQHGKKEALSRLYSGVQAFLLMICGACVVLTAVNGEWLLSFLFKSEYKEASLALTLLTAGLFFNCMAQMNINLLATIEKPGKIAAVVCAGAAVGIGGSFGGALLFGCAGVAAARSFGMATMFVVSQYYLSRRSTLKFSWKYSILVIGATGVLLIMAFYIHLPVRAGFLSAFYLLLYCVLVSPLLPQVWGLMKGLADSTKTSP